MGKPKSIPMGRGSSGLRRKGTEGDDIIKLPPGASGESWEEFINEKARPLLDGFDDPRMNTQVQKAVSTMYTRYGMSRDIELYTGPLSSVAPGAIGVNVKWGTAGGGKPVRNVVIINDRYYNGGTKKIRDLKEKAYKSGWSTPTKNPVQHTIVHELAHAKWTSEQNAPFKKQVQALYRDYLKTISNLPKSKHALGEYATKNLDEFWAETSSQYFLKPRGKTNKWTKAVGKIWEKYYRT